MFHSKQKLKRNYVLENWKKKTAIQISHKLDQLMTAGLHHLSTRSGFIKQYWPKTHEASLTNWSSHFATLPPRTLGELNGRLVWRRRLAFSCVRTCRTKAGDTVAEKLLRVTSRQRRMNKKRGTRSSPDKFTPLL